MLSGRVVGAAIVVVAVLILFMLPEPLFSLFVTLWALTSLFELYSMFNKLELSPAVLVGYFVTVLMMLSAFLIPSPGLPSGVIALAVILPFIFYLVIEKKEKALLNWSLSTVGVLYIAWLLRYFILIRHIPVTSLAASSSLFKPDAGLAWVMVIFFATWACDVGAFAVGSVFGQHKLAPGISPNKTIEGAIGGVVLTIIVTAIAIPILGHPSNILHAVVLGILIGVVAQIGDLMESLLKRQTSVKDTGTIIPGHGGILDRADSLLLVAPLVYYYVLLFQL